MEILYLHYGQFHGGDSNGWYRTYNLAKNLAILGHNVTILTTVKPTYTKSAETELYVGRLDIVAESDFLPGRARKGGFSIFAALKKAIYVLKQSKFDYCIADNIHRPSCLIPALVYKIVHRKPVIGEWWELFSGQGIYVESSVFHKVSVGLYDRVLEWSCRKYLCNGLIPISSYLYNFALNRGYDAELMQVVHAGIDDRILAFSSDSSRPATGSDAVVRLGLIGANTNEIANNLPVIRACQKLVEDGVDVSIRCSGTVDLMDDRISEYGSMFEVLGWMEYEEFIGEMSECDAFLLFQEDTVRNKARFPNKFGDYAGFLKPILTNCVGDLIHYVDRRGLIRKCVTQNDIYLQLLEIARIRVSVDFSEVSDLTWLHRARQIDALAMRVRTEYGTN